MLRPPKSMRAIRIAGFGPAETLIQAELPTPSPGAGEVVVEVAFCGICRHDLLTRAGAFPAIDLPVTLGHQISGTIVATGPATVCRVGTRVLTMSYRGCGTCRQCQTGAAARCETRRPDFLGEDFDGGYAEYVVLPEAMVVPVPAGMALAQAAVVTCTYGTAFHALLTRGEMRDGQVWVVTGASGGVGLHAVQLAASLGARVIAITTSEHKAPGLEHAGAWRTVVASDLRFARAVKELTDGAGADGVLEVVGSPTLAQTLRAVRDGGRIVVLGNVDGLTAELPPAILILKELTMLGTKSCTRGELESVLEMLADGRIELGGVTRLPLAQAADAHRRLEQGQGSARIVLEVAGEAP